MLSIEHVVPLILGGWSILTYWNELPNFDERKRTLKGKVQCCRANVRDFNRKLSYIEVVGGKKRKLDDRKWIEEGRGLVKRAKPLLNPVNGNSWGFLVGLKMRWDVSKLLQDLKVHDRLGDELLRQALSDAKGPLRGKLLPVKEVVGQVPSNTLDRLEDIFNDDRFGRIAIHGINGIGKTFLMMHLHNYGLNEFEYVFWVSSSVEFTIESLQDAVAAVVKCDFASGDHWSVRARKLSESFAKLGRFALFLDGVPKTVFSLNQFGIPVPARGSNCKLVVSTSSASLEGISFHDFKTVKVKPLPKNDAYELFINRAQIGEETISSLDGIPRKLSDRCCGVPRRIEDVASRMCGISDPHEWKNELFKLESLDEKTSLDPFK
ncbi:unnamed protein product [Amaranthus hypochondriacus]